MELVVSSHDDTMQINVSGEVDLFYSPKLRDSILEYIDQGHPVALDLSQVSYIDSSGIASIVEAFQHAKSKKLGFCLIAISTPVLQVLKLARLDKVIPTYDQLEDCLKQC